MPSDKHAPFPLARYFYLGVLPPLLLVIATTVYATTETARLSTIEVLLQLASRRVDGMAMGVQASAPDAWHKLLSNKALTITDLASLAEAFAHEQRETKITTLKVYNTDRKTVFATEPSEIGNIEDKPELRNALALGEASLLEESDSVGEPFHELYIPYRSDGRVAAVFELYEPAARFDALVWKVVRPVLIIPLALFLITLSTLAWLVSRAQADIDLRNNLIMSLRQRLESLVSSRAVAAMRLGATNHMKPEKLRVTLLYSDVRGFSGFAECHSPEEVIDFLNRVIGLQLEIIEAHGGDVDKMIGDAVLARFDGADRAVNAIDSAVAIQKRMEASGPSCRVGIGLFDGPVVAGLIGGDNRFDYTVVGDSVNNAARLCGLAKAGEIIADCATAEMATEVNFGPEEIVRVKGRSGQLVIRRLSPEEVDEKRMTS